MFKKIILISLSILLFLIGFISYVQTSNADIELSTEESEASSLTSLFSDAESLIKLKGVGPRPVIKRKTTLELRKEFCNSQKCEIVALYHGLYNEIWVRSDFEFNNEKYFHSILVHEMIHWIQYTNKVFENENKDCELWVRREYQAYELQRLWLLQNESMNTVYVPMGLARMCK